MGVTGDIPVDVSALALEATLTAIKGAGWSTETLKAIKDAVDAVIPGVGDATQVKQDAIIVDTENIQTILGTPANFKANVSALALEATLDTHNTALTAAKAVIDATKTIVDTPANFMANLTTLESRLSAARAGYLDQLDFALQEAIAALQTDLDNPAQYKANLSTLESRLSAIRAGYLDQLDFNLQEAIAALPQTMVGTNNAALASVLGALNNVAAEGAVTDIDTAMQYIKQLVTLLLQGTYGLSALQTLLAAITAAGPTKTEMDTGHGLLATPAQVATALNTYDAIKRSEATTDKDAIIAAIPAMVGTDGAALASAWTAALAGVLANYTAVRAGYLDELAAANLPADVTALNTLLSHGTYGLAALETLVDEVETYLKHATYGLAALKTAIDGIGGGGGWTTSDWKGSFNWDTSAYTTAEQDISALFSTNLALTTRRKYSVKLDLTNVEADGSFVSLYLAVKEKIDGTNYRAIDRKLVLKADIATPAEPGIIIDIPATSENIQITMQMSTALAGDATIYYAVVKEHLE